MKIYFKRNNSAIKKIVAVVCIIVGFGIALYPCITEYDMLSGARNLMEWLLSTIFLMTGAYILIDWEKTMESCSLDSVYEEDDEEW